MPYWLQAQLAGLWTLVWHYGIGVGVCICALAFAWFSPVFKKTALWVAFSALIITMSYGIGVSNGMARVQAQWDAEIAASIEQSEKARQDAESDVSRDTPERMRNDRYNRDNDKPAK